MFIDKTEVFETFSKLETSGLQFWCGTQKRAFDPKTRTLQLVLHSHKRMCTRQQNARKKNPENFKYLERKINLTLYACVQSNYQISDGHAELFRLYDDSSAGHR